MSKNSTLVKRASEYVFDLFKTRLPANRLYHNFNHTYRAAKSAKEIGEGSKLTESEQEAVLLAAWFHDAGHIELNEGHEEKSVELATAFLTAQAYPPEQIAVVAGCIRATKIPQSPKNLLEEVVCDADLSHLAADDYAVQSELLRSEWEMTQNRTYADKAWIEDSIAFFENSPFHTRYAQIELQEKRTANYLELKKRLRKLTQEAQLAETKPNPKERFAQREMEVIYRTTSRNNVDFSQIADSKANLMIQICSIIISIILAVLARRLDEYSNLAIPTLMLIIVCTVTIVFAVLSTRPKVTTADDKPSEFKTKRTNLLFFGNFMNLKLSEYETGVREMMNDKDYLFASIVKDTYFLGKVLQVKYKYLKICYDVFMYGMVASMVAFIIAMFFAN